MSWFANLKAEAARFFGRAETEVHDLVTALETDLQPILADFETNVVKAVETAVANGRLDLEALAKAVAAEVAKVLAGQQPAPAPAPAEPPAQS
jgi:hypothetical protein